MTCPSCKEPTVQRDLDLFNVPTVQRDLDLFNGTCFECFAFSIQSGDIWKQGKKTVLAECRKGTVGHMGALFVNSPLVTKGKFSGDYLVHVPTSELDNVVRRDNVEKDVADVIKACRQL